MWTTFFIPFVLKGVVCTLVGDEVNQQFVHMSHRGLTDIPDNIPSTTKILDLSFNNLMEITERSFLTLTNIITLDLSNNKISRIFVDSFKGLSNITSLNLSCNRLTARSFAEESFKHLTSLEELVINSNTGYGNQHIAYSRELYRLHHLQTLYLDSSHYVTNQFREFRCFKHLKILKFTDLINTTTNMIITNTTFKDLQQLPIEVISLPAFSVDIEAFTFFPSLHSLSVNLNWKSRNIDKLFQSLDAFQGRNMTSIYITGNPSSNALALGHAHFRYLWRICLTELYIPNNNIIRIGIAGSFTFARKSTCLQVLDMSNNPIEINNDNWGFALSSFQNLKIIRFSHLGLNGRERRSVTASNVLSLFLPFPSTLQEISITHVWTRYGLPDVTTDSGKSMKILNLAYFSFRNCLGTFRGLENLIDLDISGFICKRLNEKMISHFPKLQKFVSQNSYLGVGFKFNPDSYKFFRGLSNLSYIDILGNNFDSLPSRIFTDQQSSLIHLNLANNSFRNIPVQLTEFPKLKTCDLRFNKINTLDEHEQHMLETHKDVDILLSGNPFWCTCKQIKFLRWVKDHGISFFRNIQCISDYNTRHKIYNIINSLDNFETKCASRFWLPFAVSLTSLCILVVILSVIYHRYKYAIEYIFLKMKMKLKKYNALEQFKIYEFDAFISYSSHDATWMVQFQKTLSERGFRVCFDAKDFIAGDPIAENIVRAIDSSRNIIFIVTRKFLESLWVEYELEMARMHAFRKGRENMVIIILKEDIPIQEMPDILKKFWYKVTCVKLFDQDESMFYNTVSTALSV